MIIREYLDKWLEGFGQIIAENCVIRLVSGKDNQLGKQYLSYMTKQHTFILYRGCRIWQLRKGGSKHMFKVGQETGPIRLVDAKVITSMTDPVQETSHSQEADVLYVTRGEIIRVLHVFSCIRSARKKADSSDEDLAGDINAAYKYLTSGHARLSLEYAYAARAVEFVEEKEIAKLMQLVGEDLDLKEAIIALSKNDDLLSVYLEWLEHFENTVFLRAKHVEGQKRKEV